MKKKINILLIALLIMLIPIQGFAYDKCKPEIISKVNESSNKYMQWNLTIPQIKELKDRKVERSINKQFRNDVNSFKREVLAQAKEAYNESQETGYPYRLFEAYTEYKVHLLNPKVLSLTIDMYQYTGGAHGMTFRKAYNYNLKTGKQLAYQDIFKECVDYKSIIVNHIIEQIKKNPQDYFDDAAGTVKGFTDEQPFYMTKEGIVVYYGLYEIAPYAGGIKEFLIPVSAFKCS